jgi:hypothetical protein
MEKLKVVKQDHAGGEGAQGGAPTDHDVLEKRNQVKEVYHYINYCVSKYQLIYFFKLPVNRYLAINIERKNRTAYR